MASLSAGEAVEIAGTARGVRHEQRRRSHELADDGVGSAGPAVLFVQGQTRPAADGRTEILLTPVERDVVLAEMRHLLMLNGVGETERPARIAAS